MSTTLVLIIIAVFLGISVLIAKQWKRYRIRHTGLRVTAKITQVHVWSEPTIGDYSIQTAPLLVGGQQYEVIAEWTDPETSRIYVLTSGRKKGLPGSRQGDYLPAYISPQGSYLEL